MLSTDLPKLLQMIPEEQGRLGVTEAAVAQVVGQASPFAVMKVGGANEQTVYNTGWLRAPDVSTYEEDFEKLEPVDGKLTGAKAKTKMVESHLPSNVLHRIWALADVDADGMLSLPEYALAMHIISMKLNGKDLPTVLPPSMLPPD